MKFAPGTRVEPAGPTAPELSATAFGTVLGETVKRHGKSTSDRLFLRIRVKWDPPLVPAGSASKTTLVKPAFLRKGKIVALRHPRSGGNEPAANEFRFIRVKFGRTFEPPGQPDWWKGMRPEDTWRKSWFAPFDITLTEPPAEKPDLEMNDDVDEEEQDEKEPLSPKKPKKSPKKPKKRNAFKQLM